MRYVKDEGELNQEYDGLNIFVIGHEVMTLTEVSLVEKIVTGRVDY
jgi:hypothetical protein